MKKQTIFVLIGYDEQTETGELSNPVAFDINATTEAEALEIAKKLYEKPNYRLKGIVEAFVEDKEQQGNIFFVSCYVMSDPVNKMYKDHVQVQIFAENGEDALARAKTLVDKPFYKITDIIQK